MKVEVLGVEEFSKLHGQGKVEFVGTAAKTHGRANLLMDNLNENAFRLKEDFQTLNVFKIDGQYYMQEMKTVFTPIKLDEELIARRKELYSTINKTSSTHECNSRKKHNPSKKGHRLPEA